MLWLQWCSDAGPAGRFMGDGKYNAESPKQGCKRFNSMTKTIHFAQLGYYLSMISTLHAW